MSDIVTIEEVSTWGTLSANKDEQARYNKGSDNGCIRVTVFQHQPETPVHIELHQKTSGHKDTLWYDLSASLSNEQAMQLATGLLMAVSEAQVNLLIQDIEKRLDEKINDLIKNKQK